MNRLIRSHLENLEPYEPIDPVEVLAERAGVPVEQVIKLDGNENPYGCSPRVRQALAESNSHHIYPDPLNREVRQLLQQHTGIDTKYIAVGSGSDELIDNVLRITLEPGDRVVNCPPTFGMYPFSTTVNAGQTVSIPRKADYSIDVDAIRSAIDEQTKVVFITSPNNPTGNLTSKEDTLELLNSEALIVIDEAYHEFTGGATVADLVPEFPNLVVLRTFSKWAGLAGMRVGYGFLPERLNDINYRMKLPYNITVAAQIAVRETFADMADMQSTIDAIIAERDRLFQKLKAQGTLDPIPSWANFILCRVLKGEAKEIKLALEKKGIFIRYFDKPMLQNMIRISVGKPEHTDAVVAALNAL